MLQGTRGLHERKREAWAKPTIPVGLPLAKRHAFVARVDAVRRLQQIGRDREAALLRSGAIDEIHRLRGELRYSTPHVNAIMKRDIELLLAQLQHMPPVQRPGPLAMVTGLPPPLRRKR